MISREKICIDVPPGLESTQARVEHVHKALQILMGVAGNPPENWDVEAALTALLTKSSSRLIAAAETPEGLENLLGYPPYSGNDQENLDTSEPLEEQAEGAEWEEIRADSTIQSREAGGSGHSITAGKDRELDGSLGIDGDLARADLDQITFERLTDLTTADLENHTFEHLKSDATSDPSGLVDSALAYYKQWDESLLTAKTALSTEQERNLNQGEGSSEHVVDVAELEETLTVAELRHRGALGVLGRLGIDLDRPAEGGQARAGLKGGMPRAVSRATVAQVMEPRNVLGMSLGESARFSRDLPPKIDEEYRRRYEHHATLFEEKLGAHLRTRSASLAALKSVATLTISQMMTSLPRQQQARFIALRERVPTMSMPEVVEALLEISSGDRLRRLNAHLPWGLANELRATSRDEWDPAAMESNSFAGAMSVILELGITHVRMLNKRAVNIPEILLGVVGVLLGTGRPTLHEIMSEAQPWDKLMYNFFEFPYVDGFIRYRRVGQLGESELRSISADSLFPDEATFGFLPEGGNSYITGVDAAAQLGVDTAAWSRHLESVSTDRRSTITLDNRLQAWSKYMPTILEYESVKKIYNTAKTAKAGKGRSVPRSALELAEMKNHVWAAWANSRIAHERLLLLGNDPVRVKDEFDTWVGEKYPYAPLQSLNWRRDSASASAGMGEAYYRLHGAQATSSHSIEATPPAQFGTLSRSTARAGSSAYPDGRVRVAHLDAPVGGSGSALDRPFETPREVSQRGYAPDLTLAPGSSRGAQWRDLSSNEQKELRQLVWRELTTMRATVPSTWEEDVAVAYNRMDRAWKSGPRVHQAGKLAVYLATGKFGVLRAGARTAGFPSTDVGPELLHDMEQSETLRGEFDAGMDGQAERQDQLAAESFDERERSAADVELIGEGASATMTGGMDVLPVDGQGVDAEALLDGGLDVQSSIGENDVARQARSSSTAAFIPGVPSVQEQPGSRHGVVMGRLWRGPGDADRLLPARGVYTATLEISPFIPSDLWDAADAVMNQNPADSTPEAQRDYNEMVKEVMAPVLAATHHNVIDHLEKQGIPLNTGLAYSFAVTDPSFTNRVVFTQNLVNRIGRGITIKADGSEINICA
ncbi:hypothetical protein [Streptomyces sp. NBC_01455]|uniref:hypothetical protein n=1 Tax=Streptomyces sp. NBC_01455 TaxID=2903874 RepID=UPI002E348EDE|nr:hypothetical protein [Streptomyces sp. NBC_01455]